MTKEFIPYEQALALKELGFDEPCFAYYGEINGGEIMLFLKKNFDNQALYFLAPLKQQVFRWFREKQNIDNCISYSRIEDNSWYYQYYKSGLVGGFKTYEEAELACLKELIEIVKK
jgi:hypothetical protein